MKILVGLFTVGYCIISIASENGNEAVVKAISLVGCIVGIATLILWV